MSSGRILAAASAGIAVTMAVVYLVLVGRQGNQPAIWFLVGLVSGALLAAYGGVRGRRAPLVASGVLLLGLGLVGILSIGLPVVVGGVLAIIAAGRWEAA